MSLPEICGIHIIRYIPRSTPTHTHTIARPLSRFPVTYSATDLHSAVEGIYIFIHHALTDRHDPEGIKGITRRWRGERIRKREKNTFIRTHTLAQRNIVQTKFGATVYNIYYTLPLLVSSNTGQSCTHAHIRTETHTQQAVIRVPTTY